MTLAQNYVVDYAEINVSPKLPGGKPKLIQKKIMIFVKVNARPTNTVYLDPKEWVLKTIQKRLQLPN